MKDFDPCKLVIVDQSPEIIEVLCLLGQDMGLQVEKSTNSVDALAKIESRRPGCVIVEAAMPKIGELWFVEDIRRRYGTKILIISISAFDQQHPAVARSATLADFHFQKPFDFSDLEAIIRGQREANASDWAQAKFNE